MADFEIIDSEVETDTTSINVNDDSNIVDQINTSSIIDIPAEYSVKKIDKNEIDIEAPIELEFKKVSTKRDENNNKLETDIQAIKRSVDNPILGDIVIVDDDKKYVYTKNDSQNEHWDLFTVSDEDRKKLSDTIFIDSIVPLGVSKRIINKDGKDINVATLTFLIHTSLAELMILGKNYIIESKEQNDLIEALPFYNDDKFESYKVATGLLCRTMGCYLSDLNLTAVNITTEPYNWLHNVDSTNANEFFNSGNGQFMIESKNIFNNEDGKFIASPYIADCIKFIDSYIYGGIKNEHDLTLASILPVEKSGEDGKGFIKPPKEDIFLVDNIEDIVSMAPAVTKKQKKDITSIGVVLKISNFVSTTEKNIAYILIPFDSEEGYGIKKFKGKTIDDIMEEYYGDSDQYVSRLMIDDVRIGGLDKEYMMIKGCTKDEKYIMFLLDKAAKEKLVKMIKEY